MSDYPRLCIYCQHFDLTAAYEEPSYSTWTPGYTVGAKILCKAGHWEIDNETDNVNLYRQKIETAKDCSDLLPIKPEDWRQ